MVMAAQHPNPPDLAPYDFYRFGHMKGLFGPELFKPEERLSSAVEIILRLLKKPSLTRVIPYMSRTKV
jgi:hypothetical protein